MPTATEILQAACTSGISCLSGKNLLVAIAQGASVGGGGGGGGGTLSTDGTFAANSDLLYPSQKAAKTYVDTKVAAALTTADGLYVKKAGDTMTGTLNVYNNGNIQVGDPAAGVFQGNTRLTYDDHFPSLQFRTGATLRSQIISDVQTGDLYFDKGAGSMIFRLTNSTEYLRIYSNGNVGIRNAVPLAALHVTPAASGTDYFRIDHSDGTPRLQVGALTGSLTYGALWFGNIVPSATNYSLASDGATTLLNLPTGVGVAPTAAFHLKAGTAAANTAPQKFTPGTLLTTPELGALEFVDDGTTGHIYITVRVATVVTRVQIV